MKENIKKNLLFTILEFLSLTIHAQKYQGSIVDAESQQSLPFATIYVDADHKALANANGEFSIETSATGHAKISCVGYQEVLVPVSSLNSIIKLKPYTINLKEVTAYPIDAIINKIINKLLTETVQHKAQMSNFFFRQSTFNDKVCNEFVESCFCAKSEISLRGLSLITGRYAALPSTESNRYSYCTNFFSLSQLGILSRKVVKNMPIPILTKDYKKYYHVDYTVIQNQQHYIYIISFKAKKGIHRSILEGNLYVDSESLDVLKFAGHLSHSTLSPSKHEKLSLNLSITTLYTSQRGFTEVESEDINGSYHYLGKQIRINMLVFNMGENKFKGKKHIKYNYNLKEIIAKQKYNPQFWKINFGIKRTKLERQVIELFENKNVFTNVK